MSNMIEILMCMHGNERIKSNCSSLLLLPEHGGYLEITDYCLTRKTELVPAQYPEIMKTDSVLTGSVVHCSQCVSSFVKAADTVDFPEWSINR